MKEEALFAGTPPLPQDRPALFHWVWLSHSWGQVHLWEHHLPLPASLLYLLPGTAVDSLAVRVLLGLLVPRP